MLIYKSLRDFIRIFLPRLILEVFGGAGAIWGCSEAVGLRHPSTVWFWRPIALLVGIIFFIRWILQIVAFMKGTKVENAESEEQQTQSRQYSNIPIASSNDEELC